VPAPRGGIRGDLILGEAEDPFEPRDLGRVGDRDLDAFGDRL
jgi:hypothetical protein